MSAIRNFFKRKQLEARFKIAGPGHKLTDPTPRPLPSAPQASHQQQQAQQSRQRSQGAQKAGEAALARFEQQKQQEKAPNWSLAAIRAQARKEAELELQVEKNRQMAPKEVLQESAPVLAVSGVYYTCPLIGPDVLPRPEIEAKIRDFLYENLQAERGLTSCLIIHTCNKNKEKVKTCIETLCRYLNNIAENPTEEKYRKIRLNNKAFQERVACLEGTFDFLMAAGFEQRRMLNGDVEEDFLIFPEEKLANLETLHMLNDALLNAEPIVPTLDRGLRVLMPSQAAAKIELPDDFYCLTAKEVAQEQERKTREVELNTELRTKAMRKNDEIKELRRYRYTLIRVRFPDGIILQGTFGVREKLSAVKEFIIENLNNPSRSFELREPTSEPLKQVDSQLVELKLVPAVVLHLTWTGSDTEPGSSSTDEEAYLKPETMALLQSL